MLVSILNINSNFNEKIKIESYDKVQELIICINYTSELLKVNSNYTPSYIFDDIFVEEGDFDYSTVTDEEDANARLYYIF